MNFIAIHAHSQGVIGLVSQVIHFHAIPGVGCHLRAAKPLVHSRSDVIAWNMVGTENPLDLTHTDFIVGIKGFLDTEDMFVVVTGHIAHGHAHVDVRAGIQALGAGREFTHELRRCCTTFEADRFGTAVSFAAIDQCVLRT